MEASFQVLNTMVEIFWKRIAKTKRKERRNSLFYLGANIPLDLEAPTLGANNLFSTRRSFAPRENMKDKGIPFHNLGANILLEASTLGANYLFHIYFRHFYEFTKHFFRL